MTIGIFDDSIFFSQENKTLNVISWGYEVLCTFLKKNQEFLKRKSMSQYSNLSSLKVFI